MAGQGCRQLCRQISRAFYPSGNNQVAGNLPTEKAVLPTKNVSERAATCRTIFKKSNKSSILKNSTRSHNLNAAGSNPTPATDLWLLRGRLGATNASPLFTIYALKIKSGAWRPKPGVSDRRLEIGIEKLELETAG
jgi:hypothetical protein